MNFENEIQKLSITEHNFEDSLLREDIENSNFIILGAGNLGQEIQKKINTLGYNILAFCDNTPAKNGSSIGNNIVKSYNDTLHDHGSNVSIIVSVFNPRSQFLQIKNELISFGFNRVFSFLELFKLYPKVFLPHLHFDTIEAYLLNKTKIVSAYKLFKEFKSRQIYQDTVRFKMTFDFNKISPGDLDDYFPSTIYENECFKNSIFVDAGAFNGDSIIGFLSKSSSFKKIYAYEPDLKNFDLLCQYCNSLPPLINERITVFNLALGEKNKIQAFKNENNMGSCLDANGDVKIEVVSLDEKLGISLTFTESLFIKLDVEGNEVNAIFGMRNTIKTLSPFMAISVYHNPNDMWNIPILINEINPNYNFYLRQHGNDSMDLVLYCKPRS
jgi:FkbM family methyltransferase